MRLLKLVPDNTNIDFVRLRGWAFGLTLALTLLAVGVTFAKGLNLGVDFVGGLMIEEKFPPAFGRPGPLGRRRAGRGRSQYPDGRRRPHHQHPPAGPEVQ
ncbi:hypothetical protein GCM10020258_06340 [Sphingomonas yabuuchiae]